MPLENCRGVPTHRMTRRFSFTHKHKQNREEGKCGLSHASSRKRQKCSFAVFSILELCFVLPLLVSSSYHTFVQWEINQFHGRVFVISQMFSVRFFSSTFFACVVHAALNVVAPSPVTFFVCIACRPWRLAS